MRGAYGHRLGGSGQEQRRLPAAEVEGCDDRQDRQQRGHRSQGRQANSLTGSDINVDQLGHRSERHQGADHAGRQDRANGHPAACPSGSTLIRGVCFDLALNPTVNGVKAAANACAAKGGYLPTPMELYSVRNVINLGAGVAPDYAVADEYYANTVGSNYRTVTVDGAGKIEEIADRPAHQVHLRLPAGALNE